MRGADRSLHICVGEYFFVCVVNLLKVLPSMYKGGALVTLIGFFVVQTVLDLVLPRSVVWTHMT